MNCAGNTLGLTRGRKMMLWSYLGLLIFFALVPVLSAQIPGVQGGESQVFGSAGPDTIANDYEQATSSWISAMSGAAHTLFWSLAGIDFTWTAITMALKGVDFQQWVAGFIRKLLTIGLFAAILDNGQAWTQGLVNFFIGLGSSAGGVSTTSLSASGILGSGIDIAGAMFNGASGAASQSSQNSTFLGGAAAALTGGLGLLEHFAPTIILAIGAFFIVVSFAIVACHFVMAMVEAYVVLGAGYVFLGFGGSRWTVPYLEKYIGLLIAAGVRIMVIELLIGLAQQLSQQWIAQAQSIASVPDLLDGGTVNGAYVGIQNEFALVGSILIFGILCWTVPQIASNVIGGSLSMSGGDMIGTSAAIGGSAVAGAAIAAGSSNSSSGSNGAKSVAEITQAAGVGLAKAGTGVVAMTAAAALTGGAGAVPAAAGVVSGGTGAAAGGAGAAAASGTVASATPAVPAAEFAAVGGAGTAPGAIGGGSVTLDGATGTASNAAAEAMKASGAEGSSSNGAGGAPSNPDGAASPQGVSDRAFDRAEAGSGNKSNGSSDSGEGSSSASPASAAPGSLPSNETAADVEGAELSTEQGVADTLRGAVRKANDAVKTGQNLMRQMPNHSATIGGTSPNVSHGEEE